MLYNYTLKLGFDEKPRYTYYQNVFRERIQKSGHIDDKIYDWYLLEDEEDEDEVDIDFQVVPNEEQFIRQLTQEIEAKETKNNNAKDTPKIGE